jgi:hypothetical protein
MDKYKNIMSKLKEKGVVLDHGITAQEMIEIEKFYNISFPAELKELYSLGLPISNGFYNWRDMGSENTKLINNALEMPIKGLQSDLENGDFWCDNWELPPDNIEGAQKLLLKDYNNAPKLIPIYSHRYMPFIPDNTNIPVFSIMGSDIIYYGTDLISYLELEFGFKQYSDIMQANFQDVDFWSDLL